MTWAGTSNHPDTAFVNLCVEVSVTLDVNAEEVSMGTRPSPTEQKYLN